MISGFAREYDRWNADLKEILDSEQKYAPAQLADMIAQSLERRPQLLKLLTMNGMLKTVIDRFLPKWQELGGHELYLIITGHVGSVPGGAWGLKLSSSES